MSVACTPSALRTGDLPIAERPARRLSAPGTPWTTGSPLVDTGTINGDDALRHKAITLRTLGTAMKSLPMAHPSVTTACSAVRATAPTSH